MISVTITINNFNYGHYLSKSIDSCLNQTVSAKEIIVVDDGSQDNSKEIIGSYGCKIKAHFQPNGGQGSAYNSGWRLATGDIVIFLDSDDELLPNAVEEISKAWTQDLSKVQWPLKLVNNNSAFIGGNIPSSMHDADLMEVTKKFGIYASPPGSGNAYSKRFLDEVMPLSEADWRIAADAYLIGLSPYYGAVKSLKRDLGLYRLQDVSAHGSEFSFNHSPALPSSSVARTIASRALIWNALRNRGFVAGDGPRFHFTPAEAKTRAVSLRFFPADHPIPRESRFSLLRNALSATFEWPGYTLATRIAFCGWFIIVLMFPRSVAKHPAIWVLNPRKASGPIKALKKIILSGNK